MWMTMWKFVAHDVAAPQPEPQELGRSLRALHAALADFPGELAPLSGIRDWLERLLGELTRPDVDSLRSRLEALTPTVFASALPAQALHGDVSMSNLLRTDRGLLWNDLEDVCVGPVAWDVAGLVASARARGQNENFIAEILAAYGDPGDLAPFLEAHDLYAVVWQAFVSRAREAQRRR
jgi:Ser/Thr protein kinase RdoA (MazF antagonist)